MLLCTFAPVREACAQKEKMFQSIDRRADESWQAALKIWGWAEPGYQEKKSSELIATMLEHTGFTVRRGVAEIPTAFTATYGDEGPLIGILGEYDALPGLSQKAAPERDPVEEGGYGHGCGHHLLGIASASAAVAIAEQIKAGRIQGKIRYYGCPAEEGGGAKVFMVRAGLVADCDAILHWHPSERNSAGDKSSLARDSVKFRFRGVSAHAAGAPDQGRSALDAVELACHAAELLREHTPENTRIHHVITDGGGAPNVVPDFAEVYFYVRHPRARVVRDIYRRLVLCAQAGALATETKLEVAFEGGTVEILPNDVLAQVTLRNLRERAEHEPALTTAEQQFASRIQQTLSNPRPLDASRDVLDESGTIGMGSTDVGDVSWVVPTTGFTTVCFVPGTPPHSWQASACGGTGIARKGMLLAAKVLAATAWDLYDETEIMAAAKQELTERLGKDQYEPLIERDQKPPLNYRRSRVR